MQFLDGVCIKHFILVVLSLLLLQIVRHIGIIEHVVSHFLLSFACIVSSSNWWWCCCCCFYFRTWKCSSKHVRDFEAHTVCALQCRCGRVRLFHCSLSLSLSLCVWMWIFANTNTSETKRYILCDYANSFHSIRPPGLCVCLRSLPAHRK